MIADEDRVSGFDPTSVQGPTKYLGVGLADTLRL
jgi:hypothetical protein